MTKNAPEKPAIAVLGALAYDHITTTQTPFGGSGPGLNCKVSGTTEHLGGCGGNLVHHLAALQHSPLLLSVSGIDHARYQTALGMQNLDLAGIYHDRNAHCASAYIISDPNGQQFTAFHSGPEVLPATWVRHLGSIKSKLAHCRLMLCAPFPPELMLHTMNFVHEHNPTALVIWCPGQFTDQMDAAMLKACSGYSHWLVVNTHEAQHIHTHAPEIFRSNTTVITHGEAAVEVLLSDGREKRYAVEKVSGAVDPTGSGDAFAAGLASQLLRDTKQPLAYLDAAVDAGLQRARHCLMHHGAQPAL